MEPQLRLKRFPPSAGFEPGALAKQASAQPAAELQWFMLEGPLNASNLVYRAYRLMFSSFFQKEEEYFINSICFPGGERFVRLYGRRSILNSSWIISSYRWTDRGITILYHLISGDLAQFNISCYFFLVLARVVTALKSRAFLYGGKGGTDETAYPKMYQFTF